MHRRSFRTTQAVVAVGLVLLSGCFERSLRAIAPCERARVADTIEIENLENVDLLFVVDDSGSMQEEQSELIGQIPRLVRILATGDSGLDGTIDFHPARSIHVGIVSSDMGVALATNVSSCATGDGDDGLLRVGSTRCAMTQRGPVLEFTQGDDAATFASDVGCAANLGVSGCAEEQPLESMLKALSPSSPQVWTIPSYAAPTFIDGSGHGGDGDTNGGFIRADSVLAIILISDENDSSTTDPHLFAPDDPTYRSGNLAQRGFYFPNSLTPVERYVQGLLALRQRPGHLVFGAIVGVPPEAVHARMTPDELLALPEMEERIDPLREDRLIASCRGPFQTDGAYPGRRAIEVARGLAAAGAGTTIGSICDASFESSLDEIIQRVGEAFRGTCLPRPLGTDATGRVTCRVDEVLAPIGSTDDDRSHCSLLPSHDSYTLEAMETVLVGGELVTREVCRIHQLSRAEVGGSTPGWFYDDGSTGTNVAADCPTTGGGAQRVSIQGLTLVTGADLRFVCDEAIEGTGTTVTIGTFCNPGAAVDTCAAALAPDRRTPLVCDLFTRACAVRCSGDSECTGAGLAGQVCDSRMAMEVFASVPDGLDPTATHDVCVNAACQ